MTESANLKIPVVPAFLVDVAFQAAGGHEDASQLTWARMNTALQAVQWPLVDAVAHQRAALDVDLARTSLERIRRVVAATGDAVAQEQTAVLLSDVMRALKLD